MMHALREVQIPFLAVLLLIAGVAKVLSSGDRNDSAVTRQGRAYTVTVTVAEMTLGTLLLTTSLDAVRLACVVFFATATSVVADLTRRGAGESCGCFGGLSRTPAGRLGVIRAGLLTVAAIAATGVPYTGIQSLARADGWWVLALAAQSAVFLALSPELVSAVNRARHPVPCELRDVPLSATYAALRSSDAWREHETLLTAAEPTDVWREMCHRYLVYPAEVDGRPAEVVFAVPIDGRRAFVRAAVTDGTSWEPQDDDSGPQRVHSPV